VSAAPRSRKKASPDRPETREQLLLAASALMTERNTVDVPVGEVAARAGVNAALVNYYFRTKTGLWLELVRRDAQVALHDLDRLMALDLPPAEKLRRHIAGMIKTFFRFPYLHRLLRELLRDADTRNARELNEFFTKPVLEAQIAMIKAGVEQGDLRPIDPMVFYFAVNGVCDHLFADANAMKGLFGIKRLDEATCARCAEQAADLLMNGFRTRD